MNALQALPAFPAYTTAILILGFNLIGLANATAVTRAQAKEVINPEDQGKEKKNEVVFEGGNDRTARYRRAHRNALENAPLFMITAGILTLMGASTNVGAALFYPFAAFRILHSVCYIKGIQPFRTIFFVLSLLIQVAVLVLIGYHSFAA